MTTDRQPDLDGAAYLRLVLVGALIGIPAALVAAGFLALIHLLEGWLWHDLPVMLGATEPPPYLVIGLPIVGAAIVVAARRFLPGDGGHTPLLGLGGGVTLVRYAPSVALAAIGSLAFGAVLGPEAPLVALGSATGMAAARFVRDDPRVHAVLGTAGSFSAISAIFGGPIVGALLLVEGGLERGKALIPILLPGFVASAVGYVIFIGVRGWPGLEAPGLVVPDLPAYDATSLRDLAVAVVVGVLMAILAAAVRRSASTLAAAGGRLGMPVLLIAGGLAIGIIAQVAVSLGADPEDVLFSGQSAVPDLIGETSAGVVAILLVAKALAYVVSLGSGFRGGPVFPAIFLGIAVAMFPVIWLGMSPTVAVAIGAAAGVVAMTRLLVTAVVFAALLTGTSGADAVSAAVLAASAAWMTMTVLDRRGEPAEPTAEPTAETEVVAPDAGATERGSRAGQGG
jgi:H+/Cl- antiporter ClcA